MTPRMGLQQVGRRASFWWLASIAALLLTCAGSTTDAAEPVNVLFLFADDMRADSIAALGDRQVHTPHLDRLVQRGFAFRNAYCMGGNVSAVCLPSRNMLLSGNAYFRWRDHLRKDKPEKERGLYSPPGGANFPRVMHDAGYVTYHYGKKGNTAPPIQALFETNRYLENANEERTTGEPGETIVDDAIKFLEQDRDGKPFCMYLAFSNPHDPRVAHARYHEPYAGRTLTLPSNYLPVHPFNNGEMTVRDERLLPWPRTPAEVAQTLEDYYATITGLDHHIGRLLQRLEALDLIDNTLIVFSADQGIAIGSHGLLGKQNLYDHSMKAPLVFAGPGVPAGHSDALLYLFDIGPTIYDLVHIDPTQGGGKLNIDGRSAAAVIRGERSDHRDALLLAYRDVQRAVVTPEWKLIRYPQIDSTQLYDRRKDPDEKTNLAEEAEFSPRVRELQATLERLQIDFGDSQPWAVANPQPREWSPP